MMRSPVSYRADLADGRAVHLDGEVVDVSCHPAFAGIVDTMSSLLARSSDPEFRVESTSLGTDIAWWWQTPRSIEDLAARRRASELLAEETCGFVGRGPDHVASFFAGFAGQPEVFGARAGAVTDFWRHAAVTDAYVSYVIIPPSIDRARAAEAGKPTQETEAGKPTQETEAGKPTQETEAGKPTQVRVVDETAAGMVVHGSHILGTGTAISDWLFVSCIPPLRADQADQALSFVVPVAAAGVRVHCRKPYSATTSVFDAPFSSRFDETDAVVHFDNVMVPWDHVFVCRDVEATAAQFHTTSAHTLGNLQAQVRLMVKMRFLVGLATRIIEISGARSSTTALDALAELAALAGSTEAHVLAAEHSATLDDHGVMVPDKRFLYSTMSRQADIYPRALHLLRTLTSSQAIDLPSSVAALDHPDLVDHASSPTTTSDDRVKLYRLAWDVIGSEFAGRHHQYEMFYAGAPAVAAAHTRRTWRLEEATDLLDRTLETWDRNTPLPGHPTAPSEELDQ